MTDNNNENPKAYDVEEEIKKLYDQIPENERKIFENFEVKIAEVIAKAKEHTLDNIDTDKPLDFSEKHPGILHPQKLTTAPHEITVHVRAMVSEIDNDGHLGEPKDLFEQYYHIPVRHQKDYKIYVDKFFEKFHSNLELTCQEVHTENQNSNV
jgi:predicted Zn-dependent protease with MMP-like domain